MTNLCFFFQSDGKVLFRVPEAAYGTTKDNSGAFLLPGSLVSKLNFFPTNLYPIVPVGVDKPWKLTPGDSEGFIMGAKAGGYSGKVQFFAGIKADIDLEWLFSKQTNSFTTVSIDINN